MPAKKTAKKTSKKATAAEAPRRKLARDTYNMGPKVKNKHRAPAAQWNKMSNRAKAVYNRFLDSTTSMRGIVVADLATTIRKTQWDAIRQIMAEKAAVAVDLGRLK